MIITSYLNTYLNIPYYVYIYINISIYIYIIQYFIKEFSIKKNILVIIPYQKSSAQHIRDIPEIRQVEDHPMDSSPIHGLSHL